MPRQAGRRLEIGDRHKRGIGAADAGMQLEDGASPRRACLPSR